MKMSKITSLHDSIFQKVEELGSRSILNKLLREFLAESFTFVMKNGFNSNSATPCLLQRYIIAIRHHLFTRFNCDLHRLEMIIILGFCTFKVLGASRASHRLK